MIILIKMELMIICSMHQYKNICEKILDKLLTIKNDFELLSKLINMLSIMIYEYLKLGVVSFI